MNFFKSIKNVLKKTVDSIKSITTGSGIKKETKTTIENLNRGKEIFEKYEELRSKVSIPKPVVETANEQLFKDLQARRNEAIIDLESKLENWEKAIAVDNGLLEVDMIPFSLLTEEELSERIEEYHTIIEDAETAVRKKLVKGYDDFLHMITNTIIPDMNEGFMENLKEEFRNADLQTKSAFLETWWQEMRLLYDDLHTGTETLWGLEIQQTVAESMLDFIQTGDYNKSW